MARRRQSRFEVSKPPECQNPNSRAAKGKSCKAGTNDANRRQLELPRAIPFPYASKDIPRFSLNV